MKIEFPKRVEMKSTSKYLSSLKLEHPVVNNDTNEVPIIKNILKNQRQVVTSCKYLEFSIFPRLNIMTIEKNTIRPIL